MTGVEYEPYNKPLLASSKPIVYNPSELEEEKKEQLFPSN